MKFRTEIRVEKSPFLLSPERPAVLLGSCFASNMLERMRRCGWEAVNPLGTLYNPFSIHRSLEIALAVGNGECVEARRSVEESMFFSLGKWRSWLHDTSLASSERETTVSAFLEREMVLCEKLKAGAPLFVTFGTSWCYVLTRTDEEYIVANCHKQPAGMFDRIRGTVGDIVRKWIEMADRLKALYPSIEIVFTVSPVRHVKDGLEGNAVSKAILRLAVEEICDAKEWCHYFPAYEIVNDDLRDYRFYASDLVHPSEQAVEYIWEKFRETYLDSRGEDLLRKGEKAWKAAQHRPHPTL